MKKKKKCSDITHEMLKNQKKKVMAETLDFLKEIRESIKSKKQIVEI